MFKLPCLTCVLTLSVVALSAQVSTVLPVVRTTGMVGIGDAQTAQLNVLNPGVEAPALGIVCTATVSFVAASPGTYCEDPVCGRYHNAVEPLVYVP